MKKWAQWTRKWHRWFAIPMFVLVPASAVLRLSGNGQVLKDVPVLESVQSILFLALALTGGYLYLFRLVNKRKRRLRAEASASRLSTSSQ